MSRAWEKEKAYNLRRAEALRNEMDQAIADRNRERFMESYEKLLSHNYMSAKERKQFYVRFIKEVVANEKNRSQ